MTSFDGIVVMVMLTPSGKHVSCVALSACIFRNHLEVWSIRFLWQRSFSFMIAQAGRQLIIMHVAANISF